MTGLPAKDSTATSFLTLLMTVRLFFDLIVCVEQSLFF